MNLSKLFEMQKALDAKIIEKKGLQDMDRLPYLILALQVELGECANEWRGFKYWSNNQQPNTHQWSYDTFPPNIESYIISVYKNPLLEEYVDCLHFILSIGNSDSSLCVYDYNYKPKQLFDITKQFIYIQFCIADHFYNKNDFEEIIEVFLGLGEMLGFTWEQIEQAYMDKNKVNHERQINGY